MAVNAALFGILPLRYLSLRGHHGQGLHRRELGSNVSHLARDYQEWRRNRAATLVYLQVVFSKHLQLANANQQNYVRHRR